VPIIETSKHRVKEALFGGVFFELWLILGSIIGDGRVPRLHDLFVVCFAAAGDLTNGTSVERHSWMKVEMIHLTQTILLMVIVCFLSSVEPFVELIPCILQWALVVFSEIGYFIVIRVDVTIINTSLVLCVTLSKTSDSGD
jgi:hypothetical protein